MNSSKILNFQSSDWSTPSVPSQNIQSTRSIAQNNHHITNAWPIDPIQNQSKVQFKTKSNCSFKPLQWWSYIPIFIRGLLIGGLVTCIALAIVLPIWLVKPAKTTTIAPVKTSPLRWNTTGITLVGTTGVFDAASDHLYLPWDLTLDWSNTLYVTDRYNHRIQKFMRNAKNATTIAGQMNGTGGLAMNQFNQPTGIYLESNGDILVSDVNNNRIQSWPSASSTGQTLIGNGTAGLGSNMLFYPYQIWRDESSGLLYIADSFNHRIMRYVNNGPSGVVVAGGNGAGISRSQLSFPYAFYYDSLSNSLLIANAGGHNIVRWVIGASNWTLVAGNINGGSGSSATLLTSPSDVTLDPMGNMYVVDMGNHRIQFFSSAQSSGTTIAGTTGLSGITSNLLMFPSSIALDNQLNLYVVDQNNHRIQKFLRY